MQSKNRKRRISMFLILILMMLLNIFTLSMSTIAEDDNVLTSEADAVAAITDSVPPHIRLAYERSDQNYNGWDVWVWGTGAKDDNIDFTSLLDGRAIAQIGVGPDAERVGFIIRKENWTDREPGGDRFIEVSKSDPTTKVFVKSGETQFFTVPSVTAPEVNDGNAVIHFRDKQLYLQDEMSRIDKVELSILDSRYEMVKEEENERFVYTYENLPFGDHEYTFFVTMDGEEVETEEQYFSGVVSYYQPEIVISGTVSPEVIDYRQNAVLTLDIVTDDNVGIRELYVDLSELGGENKVVIDPELQAVSIAVEHAVTAGVKTLPLTAVDAYGNVHAGEASVTVKAREFSSEDDFDWDEAIIYFLLTDRFFNGNPANDDPYSVGYDKNDPGAYQGGDLKGITEKLDYLYELGVNTIWINPIVENIAYDVRHRDDPHITPYYGYHGYWTSNFSELNPHFGTMEEFHELIDEAHERGMKIMVDVVLNHTGYGLKEADGSLDDGSIPHFPTDEDRARFAGMLRDGGSDTVRGELAGLPDFITEYPAVREQVIEWQTQWLEKSRTPKGNTIDYFRVDTVKHVENTTWMAFKNALTAEMPEFKMIGESWGAGPRDDHGYLRSGMMDSLLDFDFKDLAREFVNGRIQSVENRLQARNEFIDNTAMLGQFLGSHDEDGFLYPFHDDTDKAGKLMAAASLQLTAKGQPVIYYGEELGVYGSANYPYYENRYNMPWEQVENNDVHVHYTKVINARKQFSQVFSKGTREMLAGSDEAGYNVFAREYAGETVIVGINTKNEAAEVTVAVPFTVGEPIVDVYSGERVTVDDNGKVTVALPSIQEGGTFILTAEAASTDPEEGGEESETPGSPTPGGEVDETKEPSSEHGNSLRTSGPGSISGTMENGNDPANELQADQMKAALPNTATTMYTYLFLGLAFLTIGTVLYIVRRGKERLE